MSERPEEAESNARSGGAIARRAGVVAAGTLTSRVLGAVRDIVIAASFHVAATDLFFIAFTIPNALRVLLGEGAVSSAFIPVFSEVRAKEGEAASRRFYARLVGVMSVVLGLTTVIGIVGAPLFVLFYAGGYHDDPSRFDTTVALTRVVFPYIFFMGLAALGMGGLNALKRFAVPAFAPALLNVALIAAPFTLVGPALALGLPAVGALALGALIGGALQVLAQLPALRRAGLLSRPRIEPRDPSVKKAFRLMVPLLAGLGIYQVNVMLGRLLATFLPEGAPSYLYYGQRLVEIPQGMFALAIAAAALPTLADLRNRGELEEARQVFGYALRLTLFLAMPATVLVFVLAEPLVTVLFERGLFGPEETAETVRSLRWQALGVWAIASVRTVVPMFHADNDTRTPVIASGVNLVVFASMALSLMGPFGHVGIAMALSGAGIVQFAVLLISLRTKRGPLGLRAVAVSAVRVTLASAASGGAAFGVAALLPFTGGPERWLSLAGTLVAALIAFVTACVLLRVPELKELTAAVRRRAKRKAR